MVTYVCVIVSTSMSTRASMRTHFYTWMVLGCWVFALPAHWIWSRSGWMAPNSDPFHIGHNGALDFGGAGPIHCLAGMVALVASWFLGPRKWAFNKSVVSILEPQPEPQKEIGEYHLPFAKFLIYVGLFALNATPGLFVAVYFGNGLNRWVALSRAQATALFAGVASPIVITGGMMWHNGKWRLPKMLPSTQLIDGILAATIACSSGSAYIEVWAAIIAGVAGVVAFFLFAWLLERIELDDPHHLIALHFAPGTISLIATGLFAAEWNLQYGHGLPEGRYGWMMWGGLEQFGVQLVAWACIVGWAFINSLVGFFVLKKLRMLRPGGKEGNKDPKRRSSRESSMTPVVDGGAGGTQISNSLEAEYNQLIPPSQTPNVQGGTLLSTHMGVYGQDGHYNNEPSPRAGGRMHGSHLDAEVPAPHSQASTMQRSYNQYGQQQHLGGYMPPGGQVHMSQGAMMSDGWPAYNQN
jgi:ammonia channel protein AmtB